MKRAVYASLLLLAGCAMGPDYRRPDIKPPENYSGAAPGTGLELFADASWSDIYTDPKLRALIAAALRGNLDLKSAVARIDEARAVLGENRLALLPTIEADASLARAKSSSDILPPGTARIRNSEEVAIGASYELDFWGRLRRSSEKARAELMASEYGKRTIATALIADVASNYFALLALDAQLQTTIRTVESREKFVDLTRAQHDRGYATGLDVAIADAQAAAARANVPDLQRRIVQLENQICLLLAENPHPIDRMQLGESMPEVPALPLAGLPSQLLDRRPDIQSAEASLRAANANVGIAKAALFPTISLSGLAGSLSTPLGNLFKSSTAEWSAAVNLVQPLLDSRQSLYQLDIADARKREALYEYERVVRTAFQEAADTLVAYSRYGENAHELANQVEGLRRAQQIALARYRAGYASYFDVINADRDLFAAELTLTQANAQGLIVFVRLYQVLGGGWQDPAVTTTRSQQSPAAEAP